MGDSGGYRRLPGGSDDFSLQTLHHNIYIIIINTGSMVIITTNSRGYHVILVINVISNRYTPSKRCISICVNISVFLQEERESD